MDTDLREAQEEVDAMTPGSPPVAGSRPPETVELVSPEALMAVTGIRRVLSESPRRITMGDKDAAEMLPREIRRSCARFVTDESGPRKVGNRGAFDYGWALEHITDAMSEDAEAPGVNPALLERLADCFRPGDDTMATGYLEIVQRMLPYLQSILPIRVETTMAKTTNFDPSDTEIARFRRAFDVADDPMIVLKDLEVGILVSDQVRHLEALYPQTYGLMKATMGTTMAEALARKKSWRLSWQRERMVQVLYQADTFSPDLAKDLQSGFSKQSETKGGSPPARSTNKGATMFQTQTGAVADGDLRR